MSRIPTAAKETMMSFMEARVPVGQWIEAKAIRRELKMSEATCSMVLHELMNEGLVERVAVPKNPNKKRFRPGGPVAPFYYRPIMKCLACGSLPGKNDPGCPNCAASKEVAPDATA